MRLPEATEPDTHDDEDTRLLKGRLEATLFLTGRPLHLRELAELLGVTTDSVETAMGALLGDYAFRGDDCALEIDDTDGYILQVKAAYQDVVQTMVPLEVSAGALRTLSVIAVKSPMAQKDLIALRGSAAYDHLGELLEKKLIARRREGRSYVISTTRQFEAAFKLTEEKQALAHWMSHPEAAPP
jgi:segregation and condensation protein B